MSPSGDERPPDSDSGEEHGKSLFAELKERQVFQAAGAYAVVAWGATEILDGVISRFGWPDWIATLAVIIFVTGFPVAMFLAWVFDWTPQGIKRDEPWTAMGWASMVAATVFLFAGSGALFWLINPSGVARTEQTGVAVLPCRYRGDPEYAFRAEGFAGIINDQLAHVPQLRVLEFATVVDVAARNLRTADWGSFADLTWLVECRLVQEDEQWRLEANIVDVDNDRSEPLVTLEIGETGPTGTLNSVSRAVLAALGMSEMSSALPVGRYPNHARSFDAYLRAEQALRSGTAAASRQARESFRLAQEGTAADLAMLREAEAWMIALEREPPESARDQAAALRAIGLMLEMTQNSGESIAELYAVRMRLAILSHQLGHGGPPDPARMLEWFERAVELKPSYAEAYRLHARYLQQAGNDAAAERWLERAGELSPVVD